MKIDLPAIDHTLRVLVRSPNGECVKVFDDSHRSFEFDLPDNVSEDEVEVVACILDECGHAVGDVFYLKEAVEIEPEDEDEDDEEAPVEADEDAPDEVVDEEAVDYPEKEVEVRELPAPRELNVDEEDAADSRYGQGCS
jgi:hypothetical protein